MVGSQGVMKVLILVVVVMMLFFGAGTMGKKYPRVMIWTANKRRRRVAGITLLVLLFLLGNLGQLYRLANGYKLQLFSYSNLSPSSPISILVLNQRFSAYVIKGYSYLGKTGVTLSSACSKVLDTDLLMVSEKLEITDDLREVRRRVYQHLLTDYPMAANCFLDSSEESEEEILSKKWFRFGGSGVWLEKYQVHLVVSRVTYSRDYRKDQPTISLLSAQVFDKNWKELKDHTLNVVASDGTEQALTFPNIFKIPIDPAPDSKFRLMGPEDPRVLLREFVNVHGKKDQEPIIIFNLLSNALDKRRGIHGFKPFDNNRAIVFRLKGLVPRGVEKNWTPFFDHSLDSNDETINFVYNFDPLVVIRCSLFNGYCDHVSGPRIEQRLLEEEKESKDAKTKEAKTKAPTRIGPLRGGTNLIPVPSERLPPHVSQNKVFWLGFPRSHINDCGCVKTFYRPHLVIISKDLTTKKFEIEYSSTLLDFNLKVIPWDATKSVCAGGLSVLIPNSVLYWDFIESEDGLVLEDLMGLTLSEADSNVEMIQFKGIWNHVHRVLSAGAINAEVEKGSKGGYSFDEDDVDVRTYRGSRLTECSIEDLDSYCKMKAIEEHWYGEDYWK